jgi:hypothetical protein
VALWGSSSLSDWKTSSHVNGGMVRRIQSGILLLTKLCSASRSAVWLVVGRYCWTTVEKYLLNASHKCCASVSVVSPSFIAVGADLELLGTSSWICFQSFVESQETHLYAGSCILQNSQLICDGLFHAYNVKCPALSSQVTSFVLLVLFLQVNVYQWFQRKGYTKCQN